MAEIKARLEAIPEGDRDALRRLAAFERVRALKGICDTEELLEVAWDLGERLKRNVENRLRPVWVATIDHSHGTNYYVGETEADVVQEVFEDYVKDYWEHEGIPGEIPEDPREALDVYFSEMADKCGGEEHLDIGPADVKRGQGA